MAASAPKKKQKQPTNTRQRNGSTHNHNKKKNDAAHPSPPNTVGQFLTSSATMVVTLIRIGSLLPNSSSLLGPGSSPQSTLQWLLHNPDLAPFWTSILMRPHETWDHVREATAVRHLLSSSGSSSGVLFRDAYRGSYIHLPPLVLVAMEALVDLVDSVVLHTSSNSRAWQPVILGMITHGIDLLIAVKFMQVGKHVLESDVLRNAWEDDLQPRIPKSLQAPLTHLFPIINSTRNRSSSDSIEPYYTNELPGMRKVEVVTEEDAKESNDKHKSDENDEVIAPETSKNDKEETSPIDESKTEEDDTVVDNDPLSPYFAWSDMPLLAAQLYYYSPWTALASGMGSTTGSFQNIWLLLLLLSLEEGTRQPSSVPLATVWLALASYMEPHYVVFLIPLSLWLQRKEERSGSSKASDVGGISSKVYTLWISFAFWFAFLQALSLMLVGKSQFGAVLYSSFGHVFTWKHLHPNFSVLWYLNMELFERYRIFFAVLFAGLPYLLVAPVTIRLYRYPMVLVTIFWMLWTITRPTTTLVDANVACCFALLCPRSLSRMRIATSLVPAFAITVPISLYLVTLWLWLETGSGEANFTFFQCLAYCGFLATFFLEFCGSSMRRDKVLRLTEKLCQEELAKTQSSSDDAPSENQ